VARSGHFLHNDEGFFALSFRTGDERFSSLGIGLAEWSMAADFTFLGRLKNFVPIGSVSNDALHSAQTIDAYRTPFQALCHELNRNL